MSETTQQILDRCFIDDPALVHIRTASGESKLLFPCIVRKSRDREDYTELLAIELDASASTVLGWQVIPVKSISSATIHSEIPIRDTEPGHVAPVDAKDEAIWNLITEFRKSYYRCGIEAGDKVRLRVEVSVRDMRGKPTGKQLLAGEIWTVTGGRRIDPGTVWLLEPNGEMSTWSDGDDFWKHFERA